jgi:DNA-binding beta-propeller fold protein YncE
VTPGPTIPWSVTNVGGFGTVAGIIYDGANIWVTDTSADTLLKLDASGNVLQTVMVGDNPQFPVYDGKNIWVGNLSHTVTVVRASTGEILATLSGNGLDPGQTRVAGFDGERILFTNFTGDRVSLWNATDFKPLGTFSTGAGTQPWGVCSDGQYFWITLRGTGQLVRF